MGSFRQSKKLIILVSNARIVFADRQAHGGLTTIASFELDDFIAGGTVPAQLGVLKSRGVELLIVPDYWLGIKPLLISSGKRSMIELYALRKLKGEHPDQPEIENFFDYLPYRGNHGPDGVQVYHFQEILFPQLYRRLEAEGLIPSRVTTPGLLWERKIDQIVTGFEKQGLFLVNLVGSECFFYFFHRGRYLFSRDISVSAQLPMEERLDALAFEIDQSRFLFSQKAKAEIDRICLVTSGDHPIQAEHLSRRLGRDVLALPVSSWAGDGRTPEELNSLLSFGAADFIDAGDHVNLAHRLLRREKEWRPVQTVGLALGSLLVVLLLGLALALAWWAPPAPRDGDLREIAQQRQEMRKIAADIDRLLTERKRPSPVHVLSSLGEAIPSEVRIEKLSLQSSPQPLLTLLGVVSAADAGEFRRVLTQVVGQLKIRFVGNDALTPESVAFEPPDQGENEGLKEYRISLTLKLQ